MKKDPASVFGMRSVDVRLTKDLKQMRKELESLRISGIDALGVAGGDGTLHQVLTAAVSVYGEKELPPFILLKSGTMNNVANSIGLDTSGPELIRSILDSYSSASDVPRSYRRTLKVNNRYGFIFGAGFTTRFLKDAYSGREKGNIQNLHTALKSILHAIVDGERSEMFSTTQGCFYADGEKLPIGHVRAVLAGTVEHIGMGFTPLCRACTDPESFQAILTSVSPIKMLFNLNRFKKGDIINDPMHIDRTTRGLKLVTDSPIEYTIDGDIYQAENQELSVETGPAVSFLHNLTAGNRRDYDAASVQRPASLEKKSAAKDITV